MECFLILDGSQHNGHCIQVYVNCVDLVYSMNRDCCQFIQPFYKNRAFDAHIDQRLYSQFVRFNQTYREISREWRNAVKFKEFRDIAIELLRTPREQFRYRVNTLILDLLLSKAIFYFKFYKKSVE
jgi:hypothetical protein